MINVVLLLAIECLPSMLSLKNLCKNTLRVSILIWDTSASLDVNTSAMDTIKLVLNVS